MKWLRRLIKRPRKREKRRRHRREDLKPHQFGFLNVKGVRVTCWKIPGDDE